MAELRIAEGTLQPCPGEGCGGKVSIDTEHVYALHFPVEPCAWFRDTPGPRIVEYVLGTRPN